MIESCESGRIAIENMEIACVSAGGRTGAYVTWLRANHGALGADRSKADYTDCQEIGSIGSRALEIVVAGHGDFTPALRLLNILMSAIIKILTALMMLDIIMVVPNSRR